MRSIKPLSFATAVVWILAECAATGASAHEFEASKTGAMLATQNNTQVINTNEGKVECTRAMAGGNAGGLKTEALELQLELKTALRSASSILR